MMKGAQLANILSHHKNTQGLFRGVYNKTNISIAPLLDLNTFNIFVFNIKQHWIALVIGNDISYFIDSLGAEPPADLQPMIQRWAQPLEMIPGKQVQSYKSIFCAYFTLYYILRVLDATPKLYLSFEDLQKNDYIISNWFHKKWPSRK